MSLSTDAKKAKTGQLVRDEKVEYGDRLTVEAALQEVLGKCLQDAHCIRVKLDQLGQFVLLTSALCQFVSYEDGLADHLLDTQSTLLLALVQDLARVDMNRILLVQDQLLLAL